MERPAGVVAIAAVFLGAAVYLAAIGMTKLAWPESVSLSLGEPLLNGLELAGPYMFLLGAAVGATVSFGLWRMSRLARRAAILLAIAGIVMIVPKVAAETGDFSLRFTFAAAAVMVRVMIVWYLWQGWTAEKFVRY